MGKHLIEPIFNKANIVCSENGRGNNWALGYSKTYKENHDLDEVCLYEKVYDVLRREAE